MNAGENRIYVNAAERAGLWRTMYLEERAKLVSPFGDGRLTGQQVAYAKGRVTLRFKALGL